MKYRISDYRKDELLNKLNNISDIEKGYGCGLNKNILLFKNLDLYLRVLKLLRLPIFVLELKIILMRVRYD